MYGSMEVAQHPIFQVIPNIATKVVEIDIQTTEKKFPMATKMTFTLGNKTRCSSLFCLLFSTYINLLFDYLSEKKPQGVMLTTIQSVDF